MDTVGGLVLDAFPEGPEFFTVQHCLSRPQRAAFFRFFDFDAAGAFAQDTGYCVTQRFEIIPEGEATIRQGIAEQVGNLSLLVEVALRDEVSPQFLRLLHAQISSLTIFFVDWNWCELVLLDHSETDAGLFFDLPLQVFRKVFVTLLRDYGQRVDFKPSLTFAVLVHAQAQATPDGLAAFPLRLYVAEGADLENVRDYPNPLARQSVKK